MKVSELMQAMADAGAPMQAILIAVQALEAKDAEIAARDAEMAEKRAKDAERKRIARASTDSPRTVQGCGADIEADPLSRPPNENNSNPPTHTPEKQTPARKGHRLPVDWQPAPLTGDVAEAVAAWPDGAIARELARFRDWARAATGPNARKSDWQAAWRNWLRRKIDEGTNQNGRNSQPSRPAIMDIGRSVAADLEREAAARAGY